MAVALEQAPSPNFQAAPGRVPRFIILHGSGGKEQGTVSWIGNKSSQVSYHYFVPKDGEPEAYQMVDDENIAWHAGYSEWVEVENGEPVAFRGLNRYSLGVAFESLNAADEVYPAKQLEVGARLVRMLMQRWSIPVERVLTHKQISDPPGRKIDPVNFPLTSFLDAIRPLQHPLQGRRIVVNDQLVGRITRAGEVGDKIYVYTEAPA